MVKGGLKLKRELATRAPIKPVGEMVLARVWVDSAVYHLDNSFSYLVPGNLSGAIAVGSFVSVPFHGRELIGVVVALEELNGAAGLKSISKTIGSVPLLTEKSIELISSAAARYAAHPFDLIRFAVPDRVAAVERDFLDISPLQTPSNSLAIRTYLQLPPAISRSSLMAGKIRELLKKGPAIALFPDLRELQAIARELTIKDIAFVEMGSHLSKSENFESYLKALSGEVTLVIGTRSAVFAPLLHVATIFIYNEGSEHFYERRSPGWNVRDISLLRSQIEKVDLVFAGYSPSVEVSRLIDEEWVSFKRARSKCSVTTIPSQMGELLPSRALSSIKKALTSGPVLFLVPLKGYAQAIRCQKCRTISRCICGGAHQKISATAKISCSHCQLMMEKWQCVWCNAEVPSLTSRGIDRHHLEIGKLLPGVKVTLSSADHIISGAIGEGIVLATPGSAPSAVDGYSAVVILEGNRFLNQPDMRSSERVREMYFAHAALARAGAPVLLIQDEGDQIATALSTWNPSIAIHRDLEERKSLSLPPYVRSAHLTMETSEITRFKNALLTAVMEERLPASTRVLGPVPSGDKSALILTVDVHDGESLLLTLHEFMRRRSAAKKTLPALRIDPYSLSR